MSSWWYQGQVEVIAMHQSGVDPCGGPSAILCTLTMTTFMPGYFELSFVVPPTEILTATHLSIHVPGLDVLHGKVEWTLGSLIGLVAY